MSLDQRQVSEALSSYAEGVVMTKSDVDRMQSDLHDRLGAGRRLGRRWVLIAAAAVLVLVVAAAAAIWLRRPVTEVPASPPQGFGPLPAITFDQDSTGSNLVAVRPDGTMSRLVSERDIVHPAPTGWTLRWRTEGPTLVRDGIGPQGQSCRGTVPWSSESDGLIRYETTLLEGPGCQSASEPPAFSTRLSPSSEAGQKLAPKSDTGQPVSDLTQLNGVWLLRGSGLLLASDLTAGADAADYFLDDDGDIDVAPDAKGSLAVAADGRITLTSAGCAEAVLENAKATGIDTLSALTVRVTSDPCNRFRGETVLTWIKVL
jgi:hypothetical protein